MNTRNAGTRTHRLIYSLYLSINENNHRELTCISFGAYRYRSETLKDKPFINLFEIMYKVDGYNETTLKGDKTLMF